MGKESAKRIDTCICITGASQIAVVVKNLPANAGDLRDPGLIPGLGKFLGGGHGNQLQYSCLENRMDSVAWWVTVCRTAESRRWLKWLSMQVTVSITGSLCCTCPLADTQRISSCGMNQMGKCLNLITSSVHWSFITDVLFHSPNTYAELLCVRCW